MAEPVAISLNWKMDVAARQVWKVSDPAEPYDGIRSKFALSPAGAASSADEITIKARVWKDKIVGWYLVPIRQLAEAGDGQFVASAIMLSLVEGIQQIFDGISKGKSELAFVNGCKRILSRKSEWSPALSPSIQEDEIWSAMYKSFRCGFAHDGFSRPAQVYQIAGSKHTVYTAIGTSSELRHPVKIELDSATATLRISLCPKLLWELLHAEVIDLAAALEQSSTPQRPNLDSLFQWPG